MSILKSHKLKLGNKCNNNCIFCDKLGIKTNIDKSLEETKQEINDLKIKDYTHLILPCNSDIRRDFFEILEYSKDRDFRIILETNGRMFYYRKFAEKVKDYVDELRICLFGQNSDTYDKNTQVKGSYNQAKEGELNMRRLNIPIKIRKVYLSAINQKFMFDKPCEVVIEVTPRCNLDCRLCFNKASFAKKSRLQKEMSTDYIKKIIDSITKSSIPQVRFSGGEPLLREDIFDLMKYAKAKGLRVWLNTNATLITEKNITKLEKYVENVLVPFNGYDAKTNFEWTKTKNNFKNKLKGIKLLKKSNIAIIRAGTVATKENINDLEKIYDAIKENKMDMWEIFRPISSKKEAHNFDVKALYDKIIKLSLDFENLIPIANAIPFCCFDSKKMDSICLGACFDDGHSRLIIDPKGFAKPSYFIHQNIGNPKNILKCWNHEFMKKMRNLEFAPEECKKCRYLGKCKGGSRYIANLCFADYKAKDPLMKRA